MLKARRYILLAWRNQSSTQFLRSVRLTKHSQPSYSEKPSLFKTWAVSLLRCCTRSQKGRLSSPGNIGFSFWDWWRMMAASLSSASRGDSGTMTLDIGMVHSSQAPRYRNTFSGGGKSGFSCAPFLSSPSSCWCRCSRISRQRRCVACGSVRSPAAKMTVGSMSRSRLRMISQSFSPTGFLAFPWVPQKGSSRLQTLFGLSPSAPTAILASLFRMYFLMAMLNSVRRSSSSSEAKVPWASSRILLYSPTKRPLSCSLERFQKYSVEKSLRKQRYFWASWSNTPFAPEVMQAMWISWPWSFSFFIVPPIEITSSSGCGEKISTFSFTVAFLAIDASSRASSSSGRLPSGQPVIFWMIFLQQQRLRSSTEPLAQSMTRLDRWWSSQSLQVSRRSGFLVFMQSQISALMIQQGLLGTTGSSISPLMTQGVLKRVSSSPAALSRKKLESGCSCRKVEGMELVNSPSMLCLTMWALLSDQAIIRIFLALRIVSMPMVIAHLGTFSIPPKLPAASFRVMRCRQTSRVMLLMGEGGSLKPMWPVRPMPRIWMSMPPQDWILRSQSAQNCTTVSLGISPLGILMFSFGMSMWLKRWQFMQQLQDSVSLFLIGQYSSRLKVTTFSKLSSPVRCSRISYLYTPIGVLPVARPSTKVSPRLFFSIIASLMILATATEASPDVGKKFGAIFSIKEKRGNLARQLLVSFTGTPFSNFSITQAQFIYYCRVEAPHFNRQTQRKEEKACCRIILCYLRWVRIWQSNNIDDAIPLSEQLFGPFPHQFSPYLRHALVKLSQLYLVLFFVLESLLHHLQLIQVLNDLGIIGLSLLVLQPQ